CGPMGDPAVPAGDLRRGDGGRAFAVALLVLLAFSWARDLWDADDGRYAAVALDMRRSGDFVTPREDGMRFVDKPPLVYWAAHAAYAVLGVSPSSARLFGLLSGAALAAAAFALAAAWTCRRAVAFAASMVAATSLAGFAPSHFVTMDMPLSAAI